MEFEPSDSTKRIREAHNQGHMKRKSAPLIDCDKKKTFRKKRLQVREDILKKFEILFGESFIAIISLISKPNPKEAIYLTIEYIHRILKLTPPKAKDKGVEHQFIYTFFWEREAKDLAKSLYDTLLFRENMGIWRENRCYDSFSCKKRYKPLGKKEIKRVYENFPSFKPQIEIRKLKNSEYRQHILKCMQNCFDSLFEIWIQMGEYSQHHQDFTQEVTTKILKRIKEPKNPNRYDKRIYSYIVQYLKHIAQKAIKARKLQLQVKECFWSKEWIEDLRHIQFHPLLKPRKTRFPQVEVFNAEIREEPIITNEKNYLGNNKEFEKELLRYLKEIKNEYLANNQK